MIKCEKEFIENVFNRLESGSILRNALKNKTFSKSQYSNRPAKIDESALAKDALGSSEHYQTMPFLIEAEFITCLNLYKTTSEQRFLQVLEDNIDMLMEERDINYNHYDQHRGIAGDGWGCNYLIKGHWAYDIGTNASIVFPICLYLSLVINNSSIYSKNKLKVAKYIKVIENITNYFLNDIKIEGEFAYIQQPWFENIEPTNHTAQYIRLLIIVYKLTGHCVYFKTAEKLVNYIRSSFRYTDDHTICWPYRANMVHQKSTHGERFWKSTWVVQMMLFCYFNGYFFSERDLNSIVHTIKTNLIRNKHEIYDSLSRQSGILIDQERIEYHALKGQAFSMRRLINFISLAVFDETLANTLEVAIINNNFFKEFNENYLALENYWVLEGLSYYLNYKNSILSIKIPSYAEMREEKRIDE